MEISSVKYSIVIIICLFQSGAESAAFEYHTYNNIQGEDPSRNYEYDIHKSDAANINNEDNNIHTESAYRNNIKTFSMNKNVGNNNIPEAYDNYNRNNNYIPGAEARNNSRGNYILVTYFFNNHKNNTINNTGNNYAPGYYTFGTNNNGSIYNTSRVPTKNVTNNSILKTTFYKCRDYVTWTDHYLGEIWYNVTTCEQYICKIGEQHIPYIQTNRCGVFVGQPNCQVKQNYGKIYPSCCPVLYCNGQYEGPVINHV